MLEDIRRFVIIADNRSLTKAAKILHLTQPALSLSLIRLEKEFACKLVSRTGKQFSLTPDGEAIYRISLRIIVLWEKAKSTKTRNSISRTLVIGLFDNAALKLAPFFQKQLHKKKNAIEIKIDSSRKLIQELQDGILDMAVCVLNKESVIEKNLLLIKKFSEELIPVSSKKTVYKNISEIPFILYNKGSFTREYIDEVFFKNGIKPNILAESTSTSFMKELAISGNGVALLPENFVSSELKEKKLFKQSLPFRFYRTIEIFLRKEGLLKRSDPLIHGIQKIFQKN